MFHLYSSLKEADSAESVSRTVSDRRSDARGKRGSSVGVCDRSCNGGRDGGGVTSNDGVVAVGAGGDGRRRNYGSSSVGGSDRCSVSPSDGGGSKNGGGSSGEYGSGNRGVTVSAGRDGRRRDDGGRSVSQRCVSNRGGEEATVSHGDGGCESDDLVHFEDCCGFSTN